jgi:PadR family transcriptional regulator
MATRRPSRQTLEVLAYLARDPGEWRHGYDLSAETGIASGTLYPLLMRLDDSGHLESKWEPSPTDGRPARHLYRLTTSGATYLAAQPSPPIRTSAHAIRGTA